MSAPLAQKLQALPADLETAGHLTPIALQPSTAAHRTHLRRTRTGHRSFPPATFHQAGRTHWPRRENEPPPWRSNCLRSRYGRSAPAHRAGKGRVLDGVVGPECLAGRRGLACLAVARDVVAALGAALGG